MIKHAHYTYAQKAHVSEDMQIAPYEKQLCQRQLMLICIKFQRYPSKSSSFHKLFSTSQPANYMYMVIPTYPSPFLLRFQGYYHDIPS